MMYSNSEEKLGVGISPTEDLSGAISSGRLSMVRTVLRADPIVAGAGHCARFVNSRKL